MRWTLVLLVVAAAVGEGAAFAGKLIPSIIIIIIIKAIALNP